MKKIIVIGCPGSGKSTFSRALHNQTGIPLYHLDMMNWNADRTTVEKSVFRELLSAVLEKVILKSREEADAFLNREKMILETSRLILRPWSENDAEDLYIYASDPEVGPPAGWHPHTSVENSREIIKTLLTHPEVYAVCLKETRKPIGNIHLNFKTDMTDRGDECELGYWIGKPFWGQGLIPEAARTLLCRAFENLRANAVWCGRYDNNEKSRRVQEKLGFVHHHTTEGLWVPQVNETRTGHVMLMTKERHQKVELFRRQKKLLDTFLGNGAISQTQYHKRLGDLRDFMEMHGVE